MKKYSHLVFDIDGTIIDSLPVYMVSLKKTLRVWILYKTWEGKNL